MAAGPAPLPPLNLSSGPAVSEAGASGNSSFTGDFFGRKKGILQTVEAIAPWLVVGVLAWAVMRK